MSQNQQDHCGSRCQVLLLVFLVAGCGARQGSDSDVVVEIDVKTIDSGSDGRSVDVRARPGDTVDSVDSDVCTPSCEGECGQDGCGGYCTVCKTPSPYFVWDNPEHQVHYTLCDESTRKCVLPTADCEDGWCRIPAGSFLMGANEGCPTPEEEGFLSPGEDFRTITHIAVITRPYRIMETEVTIQEWMYLMGGFMENPSVHADCGPTCPINSISIWDMLIFANLKSQHDGFEPCYETVGCMQDELGHFICDDGVFAGPDCNGYRLPSVAEWQLAAGTSSDKCLFTGPVNTNGCNIIGKECSEPHIMEGYAWYDGHCDVQYPSCMLAPRSSGQKCCGIHPVASLLPNPFGLYDTAGNVDEMLGTMDANNGGIPDPAEPVEVDAGYDSIRPGSVTVSGGTFCDWPYFTGSTYSRPRFAYDENAHKFGWTCGFRLAQTGW